MDSRNGETGPEAYVSPLVDFVVLAALTAVVAAALTVVVY
jgi:hypothetical protein